MKILIGNNKKYDTGIHQEVTKIVLDLFMEKFP
jgi:hypothetical protein